MYKLIAIDMDGTAFNRQRIISEENSKWIRAALESGKKVVFATGRSIGEVRPYAEQLGMRLPLIINNGSEVWETPDVLHSRKVIDPEHIASIFALIDKYGDGIEYWAHTVEGKVTYPERPAMLDIYTRNWLQFAVRTHRDVSVLQQISDELATMGVFEITNSNVNNVEVNLLGVSKASGLREVCERTGIQMSETIAIGDSLNDVSMIREAGLGVAMGNAQEIVKEVADHITLTNEEHGVARVIQDYLLD